MEQQKPNSTGSADEKFAGAIGSNQPKEVSPRLPHELEGSPEFERIKKRVNDTWDAVERGEGETLTEDQLNQRLKY